MIPEPTSSPSSVEMSSYALLTYVHSSDVSKAKPIAMWLTKQRGASGGFHGTQVCDFSEPPPQTLEPPPPWPDV